MRLISCYIDNFGKLSELGFSFENGENIICEENGWGKSTLAAFLRVMLYGFRGEGKRDGLENERKRYKPWQKGNYGGSLVFEMAGTKYRIRRVFGNKQAEDEFECSYADTNLPVTKFSNRVGEELFQIDAESFIRTVFFSQNDCVTHVTDAVNAQIGNLAQNTDDINNFEVAVKRLTELQNAMTPSRKTGALAKKKERISNLQVLCQGKEEEILASMQVIELRKEKILEEKRQLEQKKKELQRLQNDISAYKDIEAKKKEYLLLEEDYQKKQSPFLLMQAQYPKGIPSEKELENCYRISRDCMDAENVMKYCSELGTTPPYKSKEFPTKEDFSHILGVYRSFNEKWHMLGAKELSLHTLESVENDKSEQAGKAAMLVAWLLCIVLVMGGVAIGLLTPLSIVVPFSLALLGVAILLAMFLVCKISGSKKKKEKNPAISKLYQEMEEDQRVMRELEEQMQEFAAKYDFWYSENSFEDEVRNLREQSIEYERRMMDYQENKRQLEDAAKRLERGEELIRSCLSQYGISLRSDLSAQLSELQFAACEYRRIEMEYEQALRKQKEFSEKENVEELLDKKEPATDKTLEELGEEQRKTSVRLEELFVAGQSYEDQIEQLRERLDEIQTYQQEYEELTEQYARESHIYELLGQTKSMLETAKSNFMNRYTDPLMNGFNKYYQLLRGEEQKFEMDANLNLSIVEQGMAHDTTFFSTGKQDLIGICMRMAIVEAMYDKEKPFLIMDDPFVNLDDSRLEGGLQLLREIAKKYQVIYFTCHDSRCEKKGVCMDE